MNAALNETRHWYLAAFQKAKSPLCAYTFIILFFMQIFFCSSFSDVNIYCYYLSFYDKFGVFNSLSLGSGNLWYYHFYYGKKTIYKLVGSLKGLVIQEFKSCDRTLFSLFNSKSDILSFMKMRPQFLFLLQ